MLLLHHDHHPPSRCALRRDKFRGRELACRAVARSAARAKAGASGRTRTDEYEFTKLVL